jgi:hypothetical protein
MPGKAIWTAGQDTQIKRLRTEGATWDIIAGVLGLPLCSVMLRGKALGVEQPPAHAALAIDESERPPLPAGHHDTWGPINRETILRGVPFRVPGTIR